MVGLPDIGIGDCSVGLGVNLWCLFLHPEAYDVDHFKPHSRAESHFGLMVYSALVQCGYESISPLENAVVLACRTHLPMLGLVLRVNAYIAGSRRR